MIRYFVAVAFAYPITDASIRSAVIDRNSAKARFTQIESSRCASLAPAGAEQVVKGSVIATATRLTDRKMPEGGRGRPIWYR